VQTPAPSEASSDGSSSKYWELEDAVFRDNGDLELLSREILETQQTQMPFSICMEEVNATVTT